MYVGFISGRRFPGQSPDLADTLSQRGTCLLYPGRDSEPVATCAAADGDGDTRRVDTLVILDGTWDQAKKLYKWDRVREQSTKLVFSPNIFSQNPSLQRLRKVHVSVAAPSEYIVRTQPAAGCLSTLEAAAHSLAVLEARPDIVEPLVAPLVAMCNIQIRHGAVAHESRDIKTTRLENSQYQKRKPQFRP